MYVQVRANKRVYLIAANGHIQNHSQQYSTYWNAKRAAKNMFPGLQILGKDGSVIQEGSA